MSQHTVLQGDVWACLKLIPDESVDCAITSPPYYDQRDYGFEGQIGNEDTLDEYFAKLVTIYSLLRKKLSRKGVFYHNIGDKYSSKYGNTSLLMIPYTLTEYMKQDGWILVDTIIWHKPNHMPSGVENRFTNSYEPVFVFAREKNNYYSIYKEKIQQSNIIHVNLQPSKNKHVAMFPEKLVAYLIQMGIPNNATIIDPFAGSGTTSLVSQKLSNNDKQNILFDNFPIKYIEDKNQLNFRTIMIEANQDFVEIIKERCIVDKVISVEFQRFEVNKLTAINYDNFDSTDSIDFTNFKFDFANDYVVYIEPKNNYGLSETINWLNRNIEDFEDESVYFIKLFSNENMNIFKFADKIKSKWVIRNMIMVGHQNSWLPIFLIVKDIKSVNYHFNLDAVRVKHKYNSVDKFDPENFVGYPVKQSSATFLKPKSGVIVKIVEIYENGFPHWVLVRWNRKITLEEVIHNGNDTNEYVMFCPSCDLKLMKFYQYSKPISCFNCNTKLWNGIESIPKVKLRRNKVPMVDSSQFETKLYTSIQVKSTSNENYNGKFKDLDQKNIGQSPGARSSLNEEIFTTVRRFNVSQSLMSDYFNLHRIKKNLTKKAITELYPPSYKYTVGHWLRKDKGGSLPKSEDLNVLNQILDLDICYIELVDEMVLNLRSVQTDKRGKNPGDFLEMKMNDAIKFLFQVGKV